MTSLHKRYAMKFKCSGCPFNDGLTEEATHAQNLGCLPSKSEMLRILRDKQIALSCHMNKDIACIGLSKTEPDLCKTATVLDYNEWYHKGA
jgi:hypothetical protein